MTQALDAAKRARDRGVDVQVARRGLKDARAAVETRPNFREDSTVLDDPDTTDLSCAPTLDNRSPPKRRLQRLRCVLIENSASRTKPVMVPIWPSRLQATAIRVASS